jgi:hypothetical protein
MQHLIKQILTSTDERERIYARVLKPIIWSLWKDRKTEETFLMCHTLKRGEDGEWFCDKVEYEDTPPSSIDCPSAMLRKIPVKNEEWRDKVAKKKLRLIKKRNKIERLFKKTQKEGKTVRVTFKPLRGGLLNCHYLDIINISRVSLEGVYPKTGAKFKVNLSKIDKIFVLEDEEKEL